MGPPILIASRKKASSFTATISQESRTAGRACFITGENPCPHRPDQGWHAGAQLVSEGRPDHRRTAEAARLRHGSVWQEPPRRPRRVPADHARLRRFFGNLYHLNAEEEPDFPTTRRTQFKKQFGPRGVLHCVASNIFTDSLLGKGGQTIKDTGPLTKKRMETIDEEITDSAIAWMEKQAKADQPFFLWYNSTAMHFRTHVAEKNLGKSGQDPYSDRMVVHDEQIGQILNKLDELGIADNTIVMYSTDNGPENDTWPDGANTPFRGQKDTNWEGGWRCRLHALAGKDQGRLGAERHRLAHHMFPTLLSAAGNPNVKQQLIDGCTVDGQTFNVHLDGYDQFPT